MIVKILDFFLEVDNKRKFNYIAIGCTGEVIAFEHKPVFGHEFSEWSYGNNRGDVSIIGNVFQRFSTDIAKSLCWELKDVDVTNDKFLRIDGFKVINVPKDIVENYPYVAFKKVSEDITKVIFHQSEPVYYHDNLNSNGKTWEVYISGAVLKLEKEYYLTKDFVEDSAKYAFLIYHRKLLMLDEMQQTFNWVCISPGGNVCLTMERPKLGRTISDWEIENNSQIVMANYDAEDYHLSEMKLENLVVLQEAKTKMRCPSKESAIEKFVLIEDIKCLLQKPEEYQTLAGNVFTGFVDELDSTWEAHKEEDVLILQSNRNPKVKCVLRPGLLVVDYYRFKLQVVFNSKVSEVIVYPIDKNQKLDVLKMEDLSERLCLKIMKFIGVIKQIAEW